MLSQDRGDTNLRKIASNRANFMAHAFPSMYIADTTANTPDGFTIDRVYFHEFIPGSFRRLLDILNSIELLAYFTIPFKY